MPSAPSDRDIARAQYVARKANALRERYKEALQTDIKRMTPEWQREFDVSQLTQNTMPFAFEDLGEFRTKARIETPLLGDGEAVVE